MYTIYHWALGAAPSPNFKVHPLCTFPNVLIRCSTGIYHFLQNIYTKHTALN